MEPWLGICHLRKTDDTGEIYTAIAAVLCHDHKSYDHALKAVLEPQGYHIIWSEEVHPAGQWVARHPVERNAAGLARAVHVGQTVEIGTLKAVGAEGEDAPEQDSRLVIEEIEDVEPLGFQVGNDEAQTIPEALQEPLFSQLEPTEREIEQYGSAEAVPSMKVYAVLDAAKVTHLRDHVEDSDCAYECLFQGDAAQEMRDVAPYLVELDPHEDFTRDVFSASGMPRDIWGKEAGIFIRSRLSIFDLRKHFRRFTRIRVEADKRWVYFRYWEPTMIPYFLRGTDKENLEAFFSCDFELHTIDDAGKWQKITLCNRPPEITSKTVSMKEQDFESFKLYVHMRYYYQLKNWIIESFGNPCSIEDVDAFLRSEVQFAINTFRTGDKRIIAHYTAASWLLGERAWETNRLKISDILRNAGGAKRLYDRAYKYRYMIEEVA